MANGQTGNYGLNQWAAEDKVIRTEFNEDNAKIDAALTELRAQIPVLCLSRVEMKSNSSQLNLDLSGLELTQFSVYTLCLQIPPQVCTAQVRLNHATAYYSGSATNNSTFYQNSCLTGVTANELGTYMAVMRFAISHQAGSRGYLLTLEQTNYYLQSSDQGGSHYRALCCLSSLKDLVIQICPGEGSTFLPAGLKAALYAQKW